MMRKTTKILLLALLLLTTSSETNKKQYKKERIRIHIIQIDTMIFEKEIPKHFIPENQQTEFIKRVKEVGKELDVEPDWLMMIMKAESGFNPSVKSDYGTASGLIQFTEAAAGGLGTSTAAIRQMPATKQLDYILKYYQYWLKTLKLNSFEEFTDLYLVTFYPASVKRPDSFIIGSEVSMDNAKDITSRNKGIFTDPNHGLITKESFKKWVLEKKVPEEYRNKLKDNWLKRIFKATKDTVSDLNVGKDGENKGGKKTGLKVAIMSIILIGTVLLIYGIIKVRKK